MPTTRRSQVIDGEAKSQTEQKKSTVKRKRKGSDIENIPESDVKDELPDTKTIKLEQDHVKEEVMDEEEEEEDEVMDYMKRREENIRMNREFLEQMGLNQAKQDLQAAVKPKSRPASHRGLKREKVPTEPLPRRSSLRLQNKTPEGIELPPEALIRQAAMYGAVEDHSRPEAGPLEMKEILYSGCTEDDHNHMVKVVRDLETKPIKPSTVELERFRTSIQKTKITEKQVVHAVKDRSFSIGFHPSETKILAATGDKWGRLGIWDVMYQGESKTDGVTCYVPHSRPINCLEFPTALPDKVFTCSYDGSLRCGDFQKEVFDEVYSEPEEEDILLRAFSFMSPHTMLVAQNIGYVSMVDTRTSGTNAERRYQLNQRSLKSVSVHPIDTHYFCTASISQVSIWDLRQMKVQNSKALGHIQYGKGMNSAYFSPVTGKYILSTNTINTLSIIDTSVMGPSIATKKSFYHNNHTGRWLTGFRASWHPAREDVFVVGSMNRPREISLFSIQGNKIHSFLDEENLRSVCSLNAIHPTQDMVVGANSSGRLHLFM